MDSGRDRTSPGDPISIIDSRLRALGLWRSREVPWEFAGPPTSARLLDFKSGSPCLGLQNIDPTLPLSLVYFEMRWRSARERPVFFDFFLFLSFFTGKRWTVLVLS